MNLNKQFVLGMRQPGAPIEAREVGEAMANEMELVGAIPTQHPDAPGTLFRMAGHLYQSADLISREQFLQYVEAAGLPRLMFEACPGDYVFQRIQRVPD